MAMAADVLIAALRKARPSTAVAFMCSPYDVHVVPAAAAAAAKKAYGFGLTHFGLDLIFRFISLGRYASRNVFAPATFAPAEKEKEKGAVDAEVHLINGLCPDDSPNAALARRIQLWRATIEYEAGATVSAVVYPTTATLALLEENKAAPYFLGGFAHIGQVRRLSRPVALATVTALWVSPVPSRFQTVSAMWLSPGVCIASDLPFFVWTGLGGGRRCSRWRRRRR
jgi:hypothetical protein